MIALQHVTKRFQDKFYNLYGSVSIRVDIISECRRVLYNDYHNGIIYEQSTNILRSVVCTGFQKDELEISLYDSYLDRRNICH